jgi:putative flavoprotein involved in K+ transport
VGEHIRAPRLYRGKDIQWWMDAAGVHDERHDAGDDIARARRVPSLQLAGTMDRSTLDLNALTEIGVTLVGRFAGIATARRNLPARCATCARYPTSR